MWSVKISFQTVKPRQAQDHRTSQYLGTSTWLQGHRVPAEDYHMMKVRRERKAKGEDSRNDFLTPSGGRASQSRVL